MTKQVLGHVVYSTWTLNPDFLDSKQQVYPLRTKQTALPSKHAHIEMLSSLLFTSFQ